METIVIEGTPCPNCGKPIPAGALAGLCPACLLARGAESDAEDGQKGFRFEPPSIEEIAKLFPPLEILALLGAGGMGAVYKARQPVLDRLVALKILPATGAEGANFEERFNREARALARLSHPNIVAVHEFGKASNLHYFIMEFVDGANLRQLEQTGRLAPREALQIIPQICDALQYAHDEGVVHRDIKPENVLVDRKGRVKIADFGLAKILDANAEAHRLTMEGQVMGTPHYMAPEQIERPLTVDHRADIYSLGVVLYEMLTGDLPLGKFSPPSRKVQVDVRLDDVVLRALENDSERRYQNASEVKSQVETIAGTPAPVTPAPAPAENYVRWMNLPVVVERDGQRHVYKKGAGKAFAIVFGISTLVFLLISLVTGRTLFGWLGISGELSLNVRLVLSALLVAWGVWRAWHRPITPTRPRIPKRTVVLPPPGLSRKALLGACLAPMFFIAAFLWAPASIMARRDFADFSQSSTWWQILLSVTVLPLGAAAPFGTTILGWLAVGDIRRNRGIVTGLPLAVFDALFFPLLAVNALLIWVWTTSVRAVAEATGNHGFTGPWPAIASVGTVVICALATFDISRRVWRAVRRESAAKPRTAQRVAIGLTGFAAVAAGIAAIVATANKAGNRLGGIPARYQVAEFDAKSGSLIARLPPRGTVSLLAISDSGAPANAWWRPDGVAIPDTIFDVRAQSDVLNAGVKNRDFIVRWRDLPEGASGPTLRIDSGAGGSTSGGGTVFRDGKELSSAWLVRSSFPTSAQTATVWLGFGLESWRVVGTYAGNGQSSQMMVLPDVPSLHGRLHQISEEGSNVVVTMIMERQNRDWNVRVIAVDTNGVEHGVFSGASTPIENTALWTYRFKLPQAQVKEFQVQVRPVHWVEFRDAPIEPTDRAQLGRSRRPFNPTRFSGVTEVEVNELFDFDKGRTGVFPTASDGTKSYHGIERNTSWSRSRGYDVDAGTGELRLLQMGIADIPNTEWETLTPLQTEDRLSRGLYGPGRLPSTPGAPLPVTYAFRTKEGTFGLLQILGYTGSGTGMKLRYKIIERAHFD